MPLNKPSRNTDYDSIKESSTDEERLDIVFKVLLKAYTPIWLDYAKLRIPFNKEKLFNAKLRSTELVSERPSHGAYNPEFSLNERGFLILDKHGSYLNYIKYIKDQEPE